MIRVGKAIWVCLHFEYLPLDVFIDRDASRPSAVVENQQVVVADRDVVIAGMALNTAYALCPDLKAFERQRPWEATSLQQLAHWAYHITSDVVIAENNCLLLEIGCCQRLHGDLQDLLSNLRASLLERGHRIKLGVAHTAKAAELMAQGITDIALTLDNRIDIPRLQHQLNAVPIMNLAIEPKTQSRLIRMGLETLGAILALPMAGLGKRFGVDFIDYLQRVNGELPDPQLLFTPNAVFQQTLAFVDGIHQRQTLSFPMKRLILSLCDFLTAHQLYCRAFVWRLFDAHRLQAEMTVELSRAQNRWRTFLELSLLKLDSLPLQDAVYTLTLQSDRFLDAAPGALTLFEEVNSNDDAGNALIDRLSSRLGPDALCRVNAMESLWPEAASCLVPIAAHGETVAPTAGERPLWLLPEPAPIREHQQRLFWTKPLALLRGPERIDSPLQEEYPAMRDYYIAQESDGRLCWIFRELHSGRWFVHGLFA